MNDFLFVILENKCRANYICPVLNLDFGANKLPLYVQILKYILI
ncbi:Uncharacterised protein [Moraxella caprae]|uniref:Uncharacterized protein n=1 Tax=Moraxella caprae TaxID=90240 RepID=A0A378R299_9GAMM|nr:Uncharacterised protein [Moraxella caprae]